MSRVLIIAPHADDESLCCGGTILRHISEGDEVHWLLVTGMSLKNGFNRSEINRRSAEIKKVVNKYGFSSLTQLNMPPSKLRDISEQVLIKKIGKTISSVKPEIVYTVYRNDAHSDHEVVFDAVMASTKTFRYPFIRRILAYETISETDFGLKPEDGGFKPNVFVNIEGYLQRKLDILEIYKSEMGEFPFPRSREAIDALAKLRGVQCGAKAAEAFLLLKEINK